MGCIVGYIVGCSGYCIMGCIECCMCVDFCFDVCMSNVVYSCFIYGMVFSDVEIIVPGTGIIVVITIPL